jgi:hypothetical protein
MKSSKWIMGLLTFAAFLAMSTSSFAQVQLILNNVPSAAEIITNHMAETADPTSPGTGSGLTVSGSLIATSALTQTNLTITFPGTLTANTLIPAGDPIQVAASSGIFAGVTVTTVNTSKGQVVIVLPGITGNTGSGSFRLVGARIDPTGLTAPLSGSVTLASAGNGYLAPSTNSFTVISALPAGIASVTQGTFSGGSNQGTALILTNGNIAAANASLVITEGCAFCWRTTADESVTSATGGNGTNIRVTVNGIPNGVTATVSAASSSSSTTAYSLSSTTLKAPSTSSPNQNQTTITFSADSKTTVENIQLNFVFSGTPTGTVTSGTITATATLVPIGTGLDTTGALTVAAGYPVFTDVEVGPATIGSITAANTTLLVPYIVTVGNYDTGIEIANTTMDPFGGAANFGATPANGNLTFYLYSDNASRNGSATPITLVTSSTKIFGQGLDSSGNLDAGSIWTGSLASDILPAAGVTPGSTGFFGYMLIQCAFLDGHGISLTYNGAGTSYGAPLLVMPILSSSANRSNPSNGAETLNN